MDIRMPRLDGVTATRRLLDGPGPWPSVVIVTTFDDDENLYVRPCAQAPPGSCSRTRHPSS